MWRNPEELHPLKAFLQADSRAIEREVFRIPARDKLRRIFFCLFVRQNYKDKWSWGAGAEYLYRALVRGIGLHDMQDALMELAKPKRGRKRETALAARIWSMKAEGKTAPQMKAIFESEGKYFSQEKIESYLKTRRKKATA